MKSRASGRWEDGGFISIRHLGNPCVLLGIPSSLQFCWHACSQDCLFVCNLFAARIFSPDFVVRLCSWGWLNLGILVSDFVGGAATTCGNAICPNNCNETTSFIILNFALFFAAVFIFSHANDSPYSSSLTLCFICHAHEDHFHCPDACNDGLLCN